MQDGLFARVGSLPHWSGVFAWMASAWMQLLSSSVSASLTIRWRWIKGRPWNWELTTRTRKWDSDPGGTACMWLSLWTSMWSGLNALVSLVLIVRSTSRLGSGSMCGVKWARGRVKDRQAEMDWVQREALGSIRDWDRKPPQRTTQENHEGINTKNTRIFHRVQMISCIHEARLFNLGFLSENRWLSF